MQCKISNHYPVQSMKTNIVIGYVISIVYAMLGITITGSIFNNPQSFIINIIMATFVLIVSGLFYFRARAMKNMLQTVHLKEKALQEFSVSNILIQFIELIFGLLLLGMALYRTFGEGFAVFG